MSVERGFKHCFPLHMQVMETNGKGEVEAAGFQHLTLLATFV